MLNAKNYEMPIVCVTAVVSYDYMMLFILFSMSRLLSTVADKKKLQYNPSQSNECFQAAWKVSEILILKLTMWHTWSARRSSLGFEEEAAEEAGPVGCVGEPNRLAWAPVPGDDAAKGLFSCLGDVASFAFCSWGRTN